ncbi:uncharacterized protein HD556DRAFT_1313627 [Suillus plorans]|uniref:Uncharacterized protein n=1 Tax=Suillus plorans TaxID=116603 RepID=A0A9P7AC30_9AGAM|nr:uncharacterized protein HD556DRAFT_1313627 [Suillus plorans]KAG1786284.1 hypothetical protein HD556DRAFT_1313627 [Suillus plorans]
MHTYGCMASTHPAEFRKACVVQMACQMINLIPMTDLGFRGSSIDGSMNVEHPAAMTDWSKLSSSIFSQGSDAFSEAKQRVLLLMSVNAYLSSQAISQNDLDPQNIDWSKVSSNVASRVSDALAEARQLANQAAAQRDIDIQNVDQSKLLGNIVSSVTDVLTARYARVSDQNMSAKDLGLKNIDWSKVLDNVLSHASSALATAGRLVDQVFIYHNWRSAMAIMSQQYQEKLRPFIGVIFTIRHPYESAGVLLVISAFGDHAIFLALLQLTGTTAMFLCFLPARLIISCLGFGSRGVEKGSFASQYQSRHYGGNVPRGSGFAKLQSYGSVMPTVTSTLISLLAYTGAVIILGREWRMQLGDWCHFVSNGR